MKMNLSSFLSVLLVLNFTVAFVTNQICVEGRNLAKEFIHGDDDETSQGTRWAVLLAGSDGYGNYRHQADICHEYQVLKKGGLRDENIIVFMYDDIAFHEENPRPGVIINNPHGEDVYYGVRKICVEGRNLWKEFIHGDDDETSQGTRWAVLMAGSDCFDNYRHQADICHAYQVLKKGGLKDENRHSIVFMYDDIAFDETNPGPGVIINNPCCEDVHYGDPKIRVESRNLAKEFIHGDDDETSQGTRRALLSTSDASDTFSSRQSTYAAPPIPPTSDSMPKGVEIVLIIIIVLLCVAFLCLIVYLVVKYIRLFMAQRRSSATVKPVGDFAVAV